MKKTKIQSVIAIMLFVSGTMGIMAVTTPSPQMQELVNSYKTASGVKTFSAEEGKKLYYAKRLHSEKKEDRSCTSCHSDNPANAGKSSAGKAIDPISPAVSKDRFTDTKKVEKWFQRNCTWVFERECTAKEKGDFIAYMMSL